MRSELKPLYKRTLDVSYAKKLSHIGSCISALPIIYDIYKVKKPDEKFVNSAGHSHLAHLVVREAMGEIDNLEELLEKYGIHCDVRAGCDVSTGSLGHGIGIALGMALTDRTKNVHCLISDGEFMEAICMESLRIAYETHLDNLKVYLNFNGFGAYRSINKVWLEGVIKSIGFPVNVVDSSSVTSSSKYLKGLQGHYYVMDNNSYEDILREYGYS